MFFEEYKRYIKSKFNILILLLATSCVAVSYYFSYSDMKELFAQVKSGANDINVEATYEKLQSINGISFFYDFLFSSDIYIIFSVILALGFSVLLGHRLLDERQNGHGNLIVSRSSYKYFAGQVVMAQSAYIATWILSFMFLVFIISMVLFPVKGTTIHVPLAMSHTDIGHCLIIAFFQIVMLIIYEVLVIVMTSLSQVYIQNPYILMVEPLALYFVPLFLTSMVSIVSKKAAVITSYFVSERYLMSIYAFFNEHGGSIATGLVTPIFLLIIIAFLWMQNNKMERNYL